MFGEYIRRITEDTNCGSYCQLKRNAEKRHKRKAANANCYTRRHTLARAHTLSHTRQYRNLFRILYATFLNYFHWSKMNLKKSPLAPHQEALVPSFKKQCFLLFIKLSCCFTLNRIYKFLYIFLSPFIQRCNVYIYNENNCCNK